jgi:hypothetical protein
MIFKMAFFISETNREKKGLIYDGYTFRVDRVLKNSEISWRCTKNSCKFVIHKQVVNSMNHKQYSQMKGIK